MKAVDQHSIMIEVLQKYDWNADHAAAALLDGATVSKIHLRPIPKVVTGSTRQLSKQRNMDQCHARRPPRTGPLAVRSMPLVRPVCYE
jgi:hypothetical protein